MSDDTATAAPDAATDKEMLLYDYSKHLLSLALLGIGGVASLTQSPQGQKIPAVLVSFLIGILAIAGLSALTCTAAILRARQGDTAVPNSAWNYSRAAMLFLGIGVGAFLTMWIKVLIP